MGNNSFKLHPKLVLVAITSLVLISCVPFQNDNPTEVTFSRLAKIRDQEKESIGNHFVSLAQAAGSIAKDELMLESFHLLLASGPKEGEIKRLEPRQSQILDSHFVHQYGSFFDLLFVERNGFVFHSIKQESDHHSNLFSGPLASTDLSLKLQSDPGVEFVDFELYGPSGEAAAFFVTPVVQDGNTLGWFVLQYGSNELQAMLSNRETLGGTGEVYLVNKQRLMLSDSRFVNNSTILTLASNTLPVKNALQSGPGHALTVDYRGVPVFSSFDTLDFLDTAWAIIVEIDVDEVASNYLKENISRLTDKLAHKASVNCVGAKSQAKFQAEFPTDSRVDVNELRRVDNGETCWSPGVGPCTAVIAYCPGRFGYLLHIGPTDDVYTGDPLTRIILGTRRTDLLNDLQNRIARFDLVDNDMRLLRYVLIASHTNSINGILASLLDQGIKLSQVKLVHDPEAAYANVSYSQTTDEILVEWVYLGKGKPLRVSDASQLPDLSETLDILETN